MPSKLQHSQPTNHSKVAPTGPPTPSAPSASPGQAAQFLRGTLHRADLDPSSPIRQFHNWYNATGPAVAHPETCTLSTASLPSGRVSARMVYLKELDEKGFVVYSNFGTSRKGRDLFGDGGAESVGNPHVALTFWWEGLERQVRVEGKVERLSREESQKYFDTRVRGSRLGAWASRQSQILKPTEGGDDDGRKQLDGWVKEAEERFEGQEEIPVPEFWGGLRIVPDRIEFWQGRQNRLHDRFVYERAEGDREWTLERLSP